MATADSAATGNDSRGFTLIELLVVIGIIGILIAIVLGVAGGITNSGRARVTKDTIRVMEIALADYSAATGGIPPHYFLLDPRSPDPRGIPVADARGFQNTAARVILNSGGLFVEQMREVPAAYDNLVGAIPQEMFRSYSPSLATQNVNIRLPELATAFDAWGNPIRYVHPYYDGLIYGSGFDLVDPSRPVMLENDLNLVPGSDRVTWLVGEIRRNAIETSSPPEDEPDRPEEEPDSDGGLCPGGHPYFYSAGPDGKVGRGIDVDGNVIDFNEDNVYGSVKPTFQQPGGT